MGMIKRGASGRITEVSQENDGTLVCNTCSRVIISSVNLEHGRNCPYCHTDVNRGGGGDSDNGIARRC